MNREEFLERFDNQSTINNYHKSFKKLDYFLEQRNQTETEFIDNLKSLERNEKYNLLQKLVLSIKETVSPRTTRQYFDNLFLYFLIVGSPLDYTQKRIRLTFPRIIGKRFEGLDEERIKTLFGLGSKNFTGYMSFLAGGGLRETEGLRVTPSMIMFEEYPVRVVLPGTITKYSIPRETFIPPNCALRIKDIIEEKNILSDHVIFTENYNDKTLEDFEKYFAKIRTKAGLDTENRKKHQQNDITLHSLRAYFISKFTEGIYNNEKLESFGHAIAGHTKDLSVYYRTSPKVNKEKYSIVMNKLDFSYSKL